MAVRPGSARIGTTQNIVSTTASQQSAAFGSQTYMIRVASAAQAIWVKVDTNPTAATTGDGGVLVPANWCDYFVVGPGQKAAVVGGTAGALVAITEMS